MDVLIKTSRLSWYFTTSCRNCCYGSKSKTGYIYPRLHIAFDDDFTTTSTRITNKLPENWDDLFNIHCELTPEEFQFIIGKQWNKPTDRSEGDSKANHNSLSEQTEGENYCYTETNLSP